MRAAADGETRAPLSPAQQRLWFLEQRDDLGSAYHLSRTLRLRGALDDAALARALHQLVARHDALRVTFHEVDGVPEQRIAPAADAACSLAVQDLTGRADPEAELRRRTAAEMGTPFDLRRGPLFRGVLFRLGPDDHLLQLTLHHIISDAWSLRVLAEDLGALYAGALRSDADLIPPLPVPYADSLARQRPTGESVPGEEYWRQALAGVPPLLELPTDHPRPARQQFGADSIPIRFDEALTARLKALGERHGTTLFRTLLAAWAVVAGRLSGQDDVVLGVPMDNRDPRDAQRLVGFFVDTVAVRVDLAGGPTVAGLLRRVHQRTRDAKRHRDVPFEEVVRLAAPARSPAWHPLFQTGLSWHNVAQARLSLPGLHPATLESPPQQGLDLDTSLVLHEDGGGIAGTLEYATALFGRATMERWVEYLRQVLEGMAADEGQAVDRLSLMSAAERARMVQEGNAADAAHPAGCIHPLFESRAARTPDAVAVVSGDEWLTYRELDARANRLAHHLRRQGVGPGAAVGVCLDWRLELVVALLATLKAGGVYVPLDPSLPPGRLAYIAEDAEARAVITRARFAGRLPAGVSIRVDTDAERIAAEPADAPRAGVHPSDLAYVIYTSGSTGQPKGVAVEHGAAAAHLRVAAEAHGIVPEDRVLQFASAGFDVSLEQVFSPLITGATLVLRGAELWSAGEFASRVRALGITVADLPPGYWREVADGVGDDALWGVRLLLVGGEALSPAATDAHGAGRLVNCYGPTETVITATAYDVTPAAAGAPVPIGRPLPGRSVYVLDSFGAPVPAGVAGELYIGGGLLARGYLGRPALTAERFVPDPFGPAPGGRLYRTGDRVRWRECAEAGAWDSAGVDPPPAHCRTSVLEFLGRTDFQVKIRGFRIEPGEIEARLGEHPEVRDAVVLAREDGAEEARLVAYVAGGAVDPRALRAHLAERLPAYMVPAAYVRLDALPRTPNGKVDRASLPAPEADAFAVRAYEAPVGETEQTVAAIWAKMLGAERVGRHDHFFESGGHSLLAVRVVLRVRYALGVEAAPADLFERPVLADFARGLTTERPAESAAIGRVDRAAKIPLSFAQQRLWFLEQLGELGGTYHIPIRLRLRGALDRAALVRALDRIVARHEALRTAFPAVDGEPVQRITPAEESAFRLAEEDLHAWPDAEDRLRRLMADETGAPFDLEHGPLIRGRLVRMAADEHVLLLTMHHIVGDGWSAGVLHRELGALYDAFARGEADPLAPLAVQYADYAAWHRRWVGGAVLEAQAEYWTRTLAGAPELLELPADHPRPPRQDFAGDAVEVELDEAMTVALKALGQRHGATLFMTLLAGWAAVLARLSGQADVVVGTASANRGPPEVEALIGFFVNTLPVRVDLSDGPRVAELLQRVRARALEAQRNQDIPFEQVVERLRPARSLAYTPLFQVMFAWQDAAGGSPALAGLTVRDAGAAEIRTAKFDLSLTLLEEDGRIVGGMEYATALFDPATAARFVEYLRCVLAGMAADEDARVDRLPLMPQHERARVVEAWNRTDAAYPADACIHALFEARVRRAPDALAVVHEGGPLTYAVLNARANRLAHHLRARGVGPGARVALVMKRSAELVQAQLAVLKCGAAYVPLDPDHPAERLRWMLADSDPAVLLTTRALADRVGSTALPVLLLDGEAPAWVGEPETDPAVEGVTADHLAYVMYTSGSTGRPKGVMVAHRGIARLVVNNGYADFGPDDRVAFAANPAFDATTMEVWAPLVNGGRIVVIDHEVFLDPPAMARRLREQGVTALFVTTAVFNQYAAAIPEALAGVRHLLTGGERADPAAFARVLSAGGTGTLIHCYGPTEATTFAVTHLVRRVEEGAAGIPLGRPIANTRVYLLDAGGEPVPVGVAGELYLGGPGVARGYLGRPALTAERFVAHPLAGAGERLYRTGDLARWRADGTLEFLGRNDHQVKVRGYRIEPGEVEARLREHPAVREAVVAARDDVAAGRQLVAWYAADGAVEAEELRAHVGERLPAYMVPAAFVPMDALPLTPNGKVDRAALPAPAGGAVARRGGEAPVGATEQALAGIWSELLSVEGVGRGDDFFQLGGHSLLAVQVTSRVRQRLGAGIALRDVFAAPVLADLARTVDAATRATLPAMEPADRSGPLPLSFAQQRLWFLEQLGNLGSAYHVPMRLRLRGDLDRDALVRALNRIVARHEALRTSFPAVDGAPVQRIASIDERAFRLMEHDLGSAADADDQLRRVMADEAGAPFDLARGPLVRGRLVRMAPDDHVLLLTMHHIVSDGWSTGVLYRELGALYAAFARGEPDPLPPLPLQYADYAAWHRRWVDGPVLEAQAEYWTRTLAGAPELLELPADHPRPARQDFAGASVEVELDEALTAALKALSRRHGTTLFMTLLAGWAAVLARLSGQDDVVVGTPSANRGSAEVEGLIGFFVNMLPVRVELADRPRVAELLERVKGRALEAQRNQDIPFEQVVERLRLARSLAYGPLFQVMFAWQNAPGAPLQLPGLTAVGDASEEDADTAKFDLSLALGEDGGRIVGGLAYATALFERETVERHAAYFRRLLQGMVADDAARVDALPILPDAERARVLQAWNRTEAAYPAASCIHPLFEAQAARTPEAAAVIFEGETLTYAELNGRANRLAHHLRALGVGPDVRVGICVERTPGMVIGLFAVLKAGGAYVPLDPAYPPDRLAYMLADSAPAVVLTQTHLRGRTEHAGVPVLELDAAAPAWASLPATNPRVDGLRPEHLAYLIYTSGSTGRPKGVAIAHRNAVNLLDWGGKAFRDAGLERTLFSTSLNFDLAVFELFTPLARGGAVWLVEDALALADRGAGVTLINTVPSAMRALLDGGGVPPGVRTVNLAGEPLKESLVDRIFAETDVERVCNLYGPSETTTYSTGVEMRRSGGFAPHIGTPLQNTQTYVLNGAMEPAPVGVAGELCIGGAGVARGYLGRAALTAERFVPDPFGAEPGGRMYRTGDLSRWRPEGTLEFLGRADHQVKVRGFRIELGEIEARLAAHSDVREAVVLVREDTPGDARLVAYVVGGEAAEADALRAHLGRALPAYMVPAAYVRLDALPLTPNGKLDRRALPAPEGDAYARRGYEAPVGEAEAVLAGVWSELLGVERVGRHDDFFDLGGHSLLAVRVASRVRQALGVETAPADVFERPVLADFARGLAAAAHPAATTIAPVDRNGPIPLSFAQQRLWFLEQLGTLGSTYHVPLRLRLRGALDRGALVRAVDRIVARHEALRTTFPAVDGEPVQRIVPVEAGAFRLMEHDLHAAADREDAVGRLMRDEAEAPFDLARGPLVRGRLMRMAADDHVLLLTMHHIVSDGWSLGVVHRELGALYAAFVRGEADPLPPLPVQYADYAAWHRGWVGGPVLEAQAEYWTQALAGAPELLELPADHPRPARQDFGGDAVDVELDAALTAALKTLSQRHGTTLFMTLLAGWATLLARLSGQDDLVIGTPSANRGRGEVEGLIGFFVNTLPLRVDLSDAPTVSELLRRVRARALASQRNQDIPFEQVVERVQPARSLAYTPLFQVMFVWQNELGGAPALPGLAVDPAGAADLATSKFDALLALGEEDGRIAGALEYATALFDRGTVARWPGYLRRVLEAMAADDTLPIDRIPLLPDAERHLVLREWNRTEAEPLREACVHELFESRVHRTPHAVAVVFEDERVTYAELNARANRLAHHLHALGVGPDARVGICVERSVEMVVGLLAILKAGGAYVPLDASYPVDRLRYMLEDSAPAVLLTHPPLAATVAALSAGSAVPVLDLADAAAWAGRPAGNPRRGGAGRESLAYVLYTSGSTGRPKGVMLEHGSLVNRLAWIQDRYGMTPDEALLQKTPASFDVSFWEFFWPLMVGARLVMARPDGHRDPAYLAETIRRERVTVVHFVPSMLQLFLEHPDAETCTGLLRVPVSGEAISAALVRQFHQRLPGVGLYNLYGPTETGEATDWDCALAAEHGGVSIGVPIHNTTVYVLDRGGQPVPVGVAGELFIGGLAVARGYLRRPALTAARFVPDPFGRPGARMYRTGDLCRWRADGTLDFLGRTDFQVKVRGFRVEPGEVEARLAAHPGVREAVVLALDDGAGGKRLVAYVAGEAPGSETLRAYLSGHLPEYMLPAAFVRMDAFPITPNGKLDRKALPAPDAGAFAARTFEAPLGETEAALAGIWAELLGAERVGRGDDFFALGGHSLLAVRVISRVRQALGVEAAVGDLFVRPVLADFARGLGSAASAESAAIPRVDRTGPIPLSFAQQRLWFLEQVGGVGAAYHIPLHLRLRGDLHREALVRALDRVVARHEALRTVFPAVDGEPVQRIAPVEESAFRLVEHDFRALPDAEDALRRLMVDEGGTLFDLAQGPLVRGQLVRMAADDHVLLLTMHHIVSDGWSAGVLHRELGALYAAFVHGEADPLPPLPVQYADYAAWQRTWVDGAVLEAQAEYWTRTLGGAPELLELPVDHPRPARQDFAGAAVPVELGEGLTAALKSLSQRRGTTLYMTLLAGWAAVLARLSGQNDVVIGTPSANRGRGEVEELIGFFVNMLSVRVDLSGGPRVVELLERVKARALEAQRNQDIPFEQVVERLRPARSLAYNPLFQVMFLWQNAPGGDLSLPGLAVEGAGTAEGATAKFDLSLALWEGEGRISGAVEYATALFDRATVERVAGYLRRALEEMVEDDGRRVDRLALMPRSERAQVLEVWNRTDAAYPAASCIHQLFEVQAERTPQAVAIGFEGAQLTFAELNRRANRVAHQLRAIGVGPDVRVGICAERNLEMVVGLLAILKAGGAYVPLDPAYPAERLEYMLADSAPAAVLVQKALRDRVANADLPVLELDAAAPAWADRPATNPSRGALTPDHLAYVIYTSGSTGRPKGVGVPHRGVVNRLHWMQAVHGMGADEVVLQKTPYSFDVSAWEFFWPLATGARLVLARPEGHRDPAYLADVVQRERITTLHFVPSLLAAFLEHPHAGRCAGVRRVVSSGEALSAELVARFAERLPGVELHNLYGPTEASVDVTAWRYPADGAETRVPIGRPVANTRIYLVDGAGEPVPVGVAGELCIGGVQVARGYLGRAALTAERFVPDPFGGEAGGRLYRTGDRARWRSDGAIEYLGRTDFQVKVRGFRIELGEIEARLAEHAGVRDAVVVARREAPGDARLVAYVVGDETAGAEVLRAHLRVALPEHMVPAAYVRLDALPLTSSGKLDRKALPAPEDEAYARHGYEPPVGETEEALARVWSALLGVERVGRWDNFFDLGGHSLLAIRVSSRISERLRAHLPATAVFYHPHLAELARAVDESRAPRAGAADGGQAGGGVRTDLIDTFSVDMLSDDDVDALLANLLAEDGGP